MRLVKSRRVCLENPKRVIASAFITVFLFQKCHARKFFQVFYSEIPTGGLFRKLTAGLHRALVVSPKPERPLLNLTLRPTPPPPSSHPSPSLPTSAGAGVKLHTTVYVPKLGPDGMPPPPMPMLMQRSPYSAAPYGEPLLGSG